MSEQQQNGLQVSGLSMLGQLKDRREEVLAEQVHHLPVPRWTNPQIVVKYRPVEHGYIRKAQERVQNATPAKRSEVEVEANADILIRGCLAVVAVVDGAEYSLRLDDPTGEPTRFDAELAANLGCKPSAREVVKALFIAEGDIISAAGSVALFSGYKEAEATEAVLGE